MYALHERVLLVSVLTSEEPRVNEEARVDIHELPAGLTRLILQANSLKIWRAGQNKTANTYVIEIAI